MSKKRTPLESNSDDKPNNDPGVFQEDDKVKRVKLMPLSIKTLADLPLELIERILIGAIAMEVEEMRLKKSVWKKMADLAMNRFGTFCPQWKDIVTNKLFQNQVYKALDQTVEKTACLEMLHQSTALPFVTEVMPFKDELFMLSKVENANSHVINVYDRNNMEEVKYVIPLPGIEPKSMAACSTSNCLYILSIKTGDQVLVFRIAKDNDGRFTIFSPLISGWWKPVDISVARNGNIIIWKGRSREHSAKIGVYDANGSLLHRIEVPPYKCSLRLDNVVPKSNGNLVLVENTEDDCTIIGTILTELDMNGTTIRRHVSALKSPGTAFQADHHGRIVIADQLHRIQLLDSEFNLMKVIGPLAMEDLIPCATVHYNSERNELVTQLREDDGDDQVFSIFRLIDK